MCLEEHSHRRPKRDDGTMRCLQLSKGQRGGLFQPPKPLAPAFLRSCSEKRSQKKGSTFQVPTGDGERFVFRPFYLNPPDRTDLRVLSKSISLVLAH